MPLPGRGATIRPMSSYAVSWREDGGLRVVGNLRLAARELRIGDRAVRYREIRDVARGRANGDRVVALRLSGGREVEIASLDRAGSLGELERELRARAYA